MPSGNNLGCDFNQSTSIGKLPPNWSIQVDFTLPLDEDSLTAGNFSLRDLQGKSVAGTLEAAGNRAFFHPHLSPAQGKVAYPWDAKSEYRLELGKGGLASTDGRTLAENCTCRFKVLDQPVDQDGLLPSVKLLSPSQVDPVAPDSPVVLEFSEYVSPVELANLDNLHLAASPAGRQQWVRLPFSPQVTFDHLERVALATFESPWLLPTGADMKVVYAGIKDLSGKELPAGELYFSISMAGPASGVVTETFADDQMCDQGASGLDWAGGGKGGLRPGFLGGGGFLGEFVAPRGKTVIMTEDSYWPGSQTLTGRPMRVVNGQFSFIRLEIPLEAEVRFQGSYPLKLQVSGDMLVAGKLVLDGFDALGHDGGLAQPRGGEGAPGGPGGGAGGRGGGQEIFSQVTGFDGQGAVVLSGHPLAASAPGCAGRGAPGHPASGKAKDVVYDKEDTCRMVAAGGGGGGLFKAGAAGQVLVAPDPVAANRGGASARSSLFPLLPLSSQLDPLTQFLIGGGGGGGGGAHPYGSEDNFFGFVQWRAAGGGGGGGGAMSVRLGNRLLVAAGALISAEGGAGSMLNTSLAAPGGGGSGGTLLCQCGGTVIMGGTISVLGGQGGRVVDQAKDIELVGGTGSPGFCRIETPEKLSLSALANVWPPPPQETVGELKDQDVMTAGRSLIYETSRLLPDYQTFELQVLQGAQVVTYSDDPARGVLPIPGVTPVMIYFQGVHLDEGRKPVKYYPWALTPAAMTPLGGSSPQGFRFTICLDRSRLAPKTTLEVRELQVFYR